MGFRQRSEQDGPVGHLCPRGPSEAGTGFWPLLSYLGLVAALTGTPPFQYTHQFVAKVWDSGTRQVLPQTADAWLMMGSVIEW